MATSLFSTPGRDAVTKLGEQTFTYLDGSGTLQVTDSALKQLAKEQIVLQAVPPATAVMGGTGKKTVVGIQTKPEYGTGTVDLLSTTTGRPLKGSGRARGGAVLTNSKARMEIAGIRGSVPDGKIYAFLKVNDQWLGEVPLYSTDPSKVQLAIEPGVPSQPVKMTASDIPVTPTQEGVDAFTKAFGIALFTPKDIVFTASANGLVWPLPYLPSVA
ncbi:hypothetical protein [Amycolatopsis panacis]|uniref:Uncharacterized protein n=1 Tax=Amycolatopsis panacis TaxID=2340917 RepID=A0A419I4M2_9PSEU|nr:hypothetical protein [Amycolatopsis panacis]RJQ85444.1 hypothetical protein D5S19_13720 [Amycolatopsis panacis]